MALKKNALKAPEWRYRDTRDIYQKIGDWFKRPASSGIVILFATFLSYALPLLVFFMLPIVLIFFLVGTTRKQTLPMQIPMPLPGEKPKVKRDYNDTPQGYKGNYKKPRAEVYLGVDRDTGLEVWMVLSYFLRHLALFGATGAGKTEALLGINANILAMGGGLMFSDAKGDPEVIWKNAWLAHRFLRTDDFLLINYITGNKSAEEFDHKRLSNTCNPFAFGASDSSVQIMQSLIPENKGDNAVFSDRAVSLLQGIMPGLVERREKKLSELSIRQIKDHLRLDKVIELSKDSRLSDRSREAAQSYIDGLGQNLETPQGRNEAEKQHGFAVSYFGRSLATLNNTYGHIYFTDLAEVDFLDVVKNKRILMVALPALEKSPSAISELGKIILSSIRNAISVGLGSEIEGVSEDVIDNRPTKTKVPTLVNMDEFGYQATEGIAVTAAQARSLGFGMLFAGQDYAGFKGASEKEAKQIVSNTLTKIIMRIEDPEDTWKLVETFSSSSYVSVSAGHSSKNSDGSAKLGGGFADKGDSSFEKEANIKIEDIRDLTEGQAYMFYGRKQIPMAMFYADCGMLESFQVNQFLKVRQPTEAEINQTSANTSRLADWFEEQSNLVDSGENVNRKLCNPTAGLLKVFKAMRQDDVANELNAIGQGITGFMAYHQHLVSSGEIEGDYKQKISNEYNIDEIEDIFGGDDESTWGNIASSLSGSDFSDNDDDGDDTFNDDFENDYEDEEDESFLDDDELMEDIVQGGKDTIESMMTEVGIYAGNTKPGAKKVSSDIIDDLREEIKYPRLSPVNDEKMTEQALSVLERLKKSKSSDDD